ncbi:MAG: LysM peptidoglycan-binding domain-containing protein [Chloroflexi bacterium]|nr:LysM peptidoglycan-binding domain-containing protein [Chloroflexota bacterium]
MRRLLLLIALMSVSLPVVAQETAAGTTYTVRPGDTLYDIALTFGVSVSDLANANGITNINVIFPGDTLTIPAASPPPATPTATPIAGTPPYTIQRGDTLGALADRFATTLSALTRANIILNSNLIFAGDLLQIVDADTPLQVPAEYQVRAGDTLTRIARFFGTTPDEIATANSIVNPNLILSGQNLTLPNAGAPLSD